MQQTEKQSEKQLQIACVRYLRYYYPELFLHHSPNEWGYTEAQRYQGKIMGVQAGFPDLQVIAPNGQWVFIEFKSEKGKISDNQEFVLGILEKYGQCVYVIKTEEEFKKIISQHFLTFKKQLEASI